MEGTTKTKKERTVYIPHKVIELIAEFKATEKSRRKQLKISCKEDSYIFLADRTNILMSPDALTKNFKRLIEEIPELGNIKLHGLRHTAAVMRLKNGIDIKNVSDCLGHSNTLITGAIYSHVNDEDRKRASDRVAEKYLKHAHFSL